MKIKEILKQHFVDSTAMLTVSNPMFTSVELFVLRMFDKGMTTDVSLNSKLLAAGLTYTGLGLVVSKGREYSRKLFNITEKTKERYQLLHDAAYIAATNIPISAGIYLASGEKDMEKIVLGSFFSVFLGMGMGPFMGGSIDIFRDLTGIEECKRKFYPDYIKNLGSKSKKAVAGLLVGAAVGSMALMYHFNPNDPKPEYKTNFETQSVITQESLDDFVYMPDVLD